MMTVKMPKMMKSYHSSALPITTAAICRGFGASRFLPAAAGSNKVPFPNRLSIVTQCCVDFTDDYNPSAERGPSPDDANLKTVTCGECEWLGAGIIARNSR